MDDRDGLGERESGKVIYEGLYFDLAQGQVNGAPKWDSNSLV